MANPELFAIYCDHPKKVRTTLQIGSASRLMNAAQVNIVKPCPRIEKDVEFQITANYGVATSVTCKNTNCQFHAFFRPPEE